MKEGSLVKFIHNGRAMVGRVLEVRKGVFRKRYLVEHEKAHHTGFSTSYETEVVWTGKVYPYEKS